MADKFAAEETPIAHIVENSTIVGALMNAMTTLYDEASIRHNTRLKAVECVPVDVVAVADCRRACRARRASS